MVPRCRRTATKPALFDGLGNRGTGYIRCLVAAAAAVQSGTVTFDMQFWFSRCKPAPEMLTANSCMSKTALCRLRLFAFILLAINYYYSTTPPAACISKTEQCRLSHGLHFSIFYFTTVPLGNLLCHNLPFCRLLFTSTIVHAPSRLHLGNRTVRVGPDFIAFSFLTLIFYYFWLPLG